MKAASYTYCRAQSCRLKLKAPTDMPMAAFCSRGCWEKFYNSHCRVCAEHVAADRRKRGSGSVQTCSKRCLSTYRKNTAIYKGFAKTEPRPLSQTLERVNLGLKNVDFTGVISGDFPRPSSHKYAGRKLHVWGRAGYGIHELRPHSKPRLYLLGPQDTLYTDKDVEEHFLPKPKRNSKPRTLVGNDYTRRAGTPKLDPEFCRFILDVECGGFLSEDGLCEIVPKVIWQPPLGDRDIRDERGPAPGREIDTPDLPAFLRRH